MVVDAAAEGLLAKQDDRMVVVVHYNEGEVDQGDSTVEAHPIHHGLLIWQVFCFLNLNLDNHRSNQGPKEEEVLVYYRVAAYPLDN